MQNLKLNYTEAKTKQKTNLLLCRFINKTNNVNTTGQCHQQKGKKKTKPNPTCHPPKDKKRKESDDVA